MAKARTEVKNIDATTWEVTKTYKTGLVEKRVVKNPIDIWLIGNTGMRNPWRIPSGFKVYAESNMVGRLREPRDQQAFKRVLFDAGEIGGDPNKDKDASITRKYRLMFNKFGFAYPAITASDGFSQAELGNVDDITPAGRAFYNASKAANIVQAQQECFLRGLIVPMEQLDDNTAFSPLLWVLQVMFKLYELTGNTDYKINFIEFAICVQTSNPLCSLDEVCNQILKIRKERKAAENKKKYDRELIHNAWAHYFKEEDNFNEYADMNLRYLICSGIVKRAGRGITLVEEYKSLEKELSKGALSTASLKDRYKMLCNGAPLPTDNAIVAQKVLQDLIDELNRYHISYTLPSIPLDTPQNINTVRMILKRDIDRYKEEEYARNQRLCWKEIYEYMQLLIINDGREKELDDDTIIKVPKSEASAYLEWVLWRAFLAINHLTNKPYDARGFNIDQDHFPVGTAPGGGPDMIFEFDDCVIVVEVTLSTNSRQEAMEGEPVRRHVADQLEKYDKPVYGLFVAKRIDSNTAETFRIGVWYTKDDDRLSLRIIPFTLSQFSEFFKALFSAGTANPHEVVSLLDECESQRENGYAPEWKATIEQIVQRRVST